MFDLKAFISACAALIYCAIIIITFKFNHLVKSSSGVWGEKANKKASRMGCVSETHMCFLHLCVRNTYTHIHQYTRA